MALYWDKKPSKVHRINHGVKDFTCELCNNKQMGYIEFGSHIKKEHANGIRKKFVAVEYF